MVERFQMKTEHDWICARLDERGDWVRHSDYAELAAENERLKQRLANHPRATNTVNAHETANVNDKPEGQQESVAAGQHVAYFDDGQFHWMSGIAPRNCELYPRPSEQAVTNEMVDAAYEKVRRMPASVDTADGDLDAIIR